MNRRFRTVATRMVAVAVCASGLTHSVQVAAQPTNPSDSAIVEADQAVTESNGDVSRLVTSISEKDAEVRRLENEMGGLREAVNKAIVDLHDAQATAETARQDARNARTRLQDTQSNLEQAQAALDEIARTAYRRGASSPGVAGMSGKSTDRNGLDRQTFLRMRAENQQKVIERLERLRTEEANQDSLLRQAQQHAEERETSAEQARAEAEANIERNKALLQAKQGEREGLVRQRSDAEQRLARARTLVQDLGRQRAEYQDFERAEQERKATEAQAEAARQEADAKAEEQRRREAEAVQAQQQAEAASGGDEQISAQERAEIAAQEAEEARVRAEQEAHNAEQAELLKQAALAAAALAAEALIQAGTPNHQDLEDPYNTSDISSADGGVESQQEGFTFASEADNSYTSLSESASETISGSREEKVELVINRAMSQIGTPYAWGGGNASGPTQGIPDGGVADSHGDFNKVGFDCSGLMVYAFAGIGISLPHYTGYQYNHGTKIDPSEMQRGDLIFYGPNAEHHVAIYLGDGTMLEAPQSGSSVQVSPVRWSGMSPYAVRLIQ
ncbi:Peptidoglycan endopeptidase RipA precursor [Corynebacterium freiburgense]|nr:NlpC/P60 family protein [Corynebacterium freiburgense]WJZ02682.1 Peptidoglycan endopeptidase RipA precursor [Corynebacterium freiburgense]